MHCTGWWEKLSGVIYQNHLAHGICSVAAKQQGLCCCHRMKPSLPATAYVISLAAVLLLQYTKHSPTPGPLHSLFFLPTTLPPPTLLYLENSYSFFKFQLKQHFITELALRLCQPLLAILVASPSSPSNPIFILSFCV